MYGSVYGMRKTTVYLPDELKAALERAAAAEQRSEAELIREAIGAAVAQRQVPAPTVPLGTHRLGDPSVARRVEELLDGFGG